MLHFYHDEFANFLVRPRMYRLNTKQLLVQHVLLPGYTLLPSPWEHLCGFMEPFCRRIVTQLVDCCLQLLFLNKFQITDGYLTV
jgi:hypothetical protein